MLLLLLFVAEAFTAPFEATQRAVVPDVLTDPRDYLVGQRPDAGALPARPGHRHRARPAWSSYSVGERVGLLIDVASFVLSFLVIAVTLRPRPALRDDLTRADLVARPTSRAGWRLVFDDPAVRALVLLGWGASVFLIAPEAVALAYARADGAGATVGAALMASLPAGAAMGAYLVSRLDPMRQVRSIVPLRCAGLPAAAVHLRSPRPGGRAGAVVPQRACQGFMIPLMATVNLMSTGLSAVG